MWKWVIIIKNVYIITGAGGFLGDNIVRLLQNKNADIRCLVKNNSIVLKGLRCQIYKGDVKYKETLSKLFDVKNYKNVYVIHAASEVRLKRISCQISIIL